MSWMDELLAKFGADATVNRQAEIVQASGELPAPSSEQAQRTRENAGALGACLLLGGGWLVWSWLKKRRRRRRR